MAIEFDPKRVNKEELTSVEKTILGGMARLYWLLTQSPNVARYPSDDRRRIIFQLINHRYNEGLPTLLTTNLQGKQIAEQFGARVFERIIESCVWHTVTGRNLRME
jgi:hypothetical protein